MKYLFTLLLSATFLSGSAQDTLYQFLSYSKELSDTINSFYIRMAVKKGELWHVKDFYREGRTLALQGTYADDSMKVPAGVFTEYHTNGQVGTTGRYVNGQKSGLWKSYSRNGQLFDSAYYSHDIPFNARYRWDMDRRITFKGVYDPDGRGIGTETSFHDNGSIDSHGIRSEGYKKDSVWTYYFRSGKVSFREWYHKGQLTERECFDEKGNKSRACDSMNMPEFAGDIDEFLQNTVNYPKTYREYDLPAIKVIARFTVNKYGKVKDVHIVQKSLPEFEKEVIRVIEKMPKWKPGKHYNRPVDIYYTLPMVFRQAQ